MSVSTRTEIAALDEPLPTAARVVVRYPVLTDREPERAAFDEAVRHIGVRGSAIVVTGPAGAGKTRLAQAFASSARGAGLPFLVGRAVPDGAPAPLRPLMEMARGLSRDGLLPAQEDLGPYGAPLGRIVAEWTGQHAPPVEARSTPVVAEAILRLLRLVAPRGCVLLMEDLHWADEETLAVLEYLCDHVEEAPLIVVATARQEDSAVTRACLTAVVRRGAADHLPLTPPAATGGRPADQQRSWSWPRHLTRRLVADAVPRAPREQHRGRDMTSVTPREREVLSLLREGLTNASLGRRLSISPRTVEKHVASLCQKLDANDRWKLIALSTQS